uniref:Uncharacterized protein n=1 Tax=Noctiluca scintillans TaxID=2966 RepID=A0A7S1AEK4_NOCSC|mmetsp:Transcript_43014/g.113343  ORF Transcript_43014/g.113343 Transcript_43014/m.113343 type:complete len:231 (+) Transcript_43014:92-784(+)
MPRTKAPRRKEPRTKNPRTKERGTKEPSCPLEDAFCEMVKPWLQGFIHFLRVRREALAVAAGTHPLYPDAWLLGGRARMEWSELTFEEQRNWHAKSLSAQAGAAPLFEATLPQSTECEVLDDDVRSRSSAESVVPSTRRRLPNQRRRWPSSDEAGLEIDLETVEVRSRSPSLEIEVAVRVCPAQEYGQPRALGASSRARKFRTEDVQIVFSDSEPPSDLRVETADEWAKK